jgi:hypothetical protein
MAGQHIADAILPARWLLAAAVLESVAKRLGATSMAVAQSWLL